MPPNEYIETRNGGYYIVGTRIGLDALVYAFRRGETPEEIFHAYPSIGSLAKVYGALTLILENREEIEAYLRDQDRLWQEFGKSIRSSRMSNSGSLTPTKTRHAGNNRFENPFLGRCRSASGDRTRTDAA